MPIPPLTPVELSDPSPPVPGERERAAVRSRARQLVRRRRAVHGAAVTGVVVAVAVAASSVLLSSGPARDPAVGVASLVVHATTLEPGTTVTVELRDGERVVQGAAGDDGVVRFDDDVAPGTYEVFVTTEGPDTPPSPDGVQLGRGVTTYRSITLTLEAGVNSLDLDSLTPSTP